MKPSLYNHVLSLPEGVSLFFNFITLNLLVLNGAEAEAAREILKDPNALTASRPRRLRALLMSKGFLVQNRVEEVAQLRKEHESAQSRSGGYLGLTIVPTLSCNFRCSYCFEAPQGSSMSPAVEMTLIRFVRNRLARGTAGLSITWFGGEPLVRMDIIERLSTAFLHATRATGAEYRAGIITNGYLLTGERAQKLRALGVTNAQVTVDGPPAVHDRRRPMKDGGPTFASILANLKESAETLDLTVRVNVDLGNTEHIPVLLDILKGEGLHTKLRVYLGYTYPYTKACAGIAPACLPRQEYALLGLEALYEMLSRGYTRLPFGAPRRTSNYCMAGMNDAFLVMPSGALADCYSEIGDPNAEVAHLNQDETELHRKNRQRWQVWKPFESDCSRCLLLPVCAGGCPYVARISGRPSCESWKYHLDERLLFYYYLSRMRQEASAYDVYRETVDAVKRLAESTHRRIGSRSSRADRPAHRQARRVAVAVQ